MFIGTKKPSDPKEPINPIQFEWFRLNYQLVWIGFNSNKKNITGFG